MPDQPPGENQTNERRVIFGERVAAIEKIVEINREHGITVLLVEQNANLALEISHFGYVLETGRINLQDTSAALRQNPQVKSAYLGGG